MLKLKILYLIPIMIMLVILPYFLKGYYLYVCMMVMIFGLVSLGLNILTGYAGLISLGHAGFFCIGAYATAIFSNYGLPIFLSLFLAGMFSAICGIILGFPSIRLTGFHLAIATLAFGVVVEKLFYSWESVSGGGAGLLVSKAKLFSFVFDSDQKLYYLILVIVFGLTLFARNVLDRRTGRALLAIREGEIAASTLGVNLLFSKLNAFMLSAFYSGVAGGLYAHAIGQLNVQSFNIGLSFSFLIMVIIGGLGSILGSFLGSVFVMGLPEVLRFIKEYQALVYGLTLLLVIIYLPEGIQGIIRRMLKPIMASKL